jgi:hypothetical protein
MDRFTEEKTSWKVNAGATTRPIGVASLPDQSVHVLVSNPLSIARFSSF